MYLLFLKILICKSIQGIIDAVNPKYENGQNDGGINDAPDKIFSFKNPFTDRYFVVFFYAVCNYDNCNSKKYKGSFFRACAVLLVYVSLKDSLQIKIGTYIFKNPASIFQAFR